MKKKGDLTIYFIIEILAVIVVVWLLYNVALGFGTGEAYKKIKIVEEKALELNTLSALSGNAYITNEGTGNYSFNFNKNNVELYDEVEFIKTSYPIVLPEYINLDYKFSNPKKIIISKIMGNIILGEEIKNINSQSSYTIQESGKKKKISDITVLIDPGHGGNPSKYYMEGSTREYSVDMSTLTDEQKKNYFKGDAGFVNNNLIESDITFDISSSIKSDLEDKNKNIFLTREDKSFFMHIGDRIDKVNNINPDLMLSMHLGQNNNQPSQNGINIYYLYGSKNKNEDIMLANLIISNLHKGFDLDYALITPVFSNDLTLDNPMRILTGEGISLYLEIGNTNSNKINDMLTKENQFKISGIIGKSILDYYGN